MPPSKKDEMQRTRSWTYSVILTLALLLTGTTSAILAPNTASAQELTEARRVRIARLLARSTVSVLAGPSTGSGFVVGQERWVITNFHVIEHVARGTQVQVRFSSGTTLSARILETDRRATTSRSSRSPAVTFLHRRSRWRTRTQSSWASRCSRSVARSGSTGRSPKASSAHVATSRAWAVAWRTTSSRPTRRSIRATRVARSSITAAASSA